MSTARVAKPGLVFFAFAAINRLVASPDQRAWFERLWESCALLGMNCPITGIAPIDFPASLAGVMDAPAYRVLASRESTQPGVSQALLFTSHDVLGLLTVIAPDPPRPWPELTRALVQAAQDTGCDIADGPIGMLGTATVRLGLISDSSGQVPRPPDLTEPEDAGAWPSDWTLLSSGFLVAQAAASTEGSQRLLTAVAPAAQEAELDRWTWSSARQLPPLARYLLHTAKLRDQLTVFEQGQFRAVRRKVDQRVDQLMLLDIEQADLKRLSAARATLARQQADVDGLVTTLARVRIMKRTVEIALANINSAIHVPDSRFDYGQLFTTTQEIGSWLLDSLNDSETYLEATLARVNNVGTLISDAVEERRQRYQQRLTLLQASVIGAAVMALTMVQALQYHLPVPETVQAPFIVTIAGVTLVLPGAILRWTRGIGREEPLSTVDTAMLAVPGAAIGWLLSSITDLAGRPNLPLSLVAAICGAVVLPFLGHFALRRLTRSHSPTR